MDLVFIVIGVERDFAFYVFVFKIIICLFLNDIICETYGVYIYFEISKDKKRYKIHVIIKETHN